MTIRSSALALGHASTLANVLSAAVLHDIGGTGSKKKTLPIKGDAAGFRCTTTDDLIDDRLGGTKTARGAGFTATAIDPSAVERCSPFCHCAGLAKGSTLQ